jgi:hypothetical protein
MNLNRTNKIGIRTGPKESDKSEGKANGRSLLMRIFGFSYSESAKGNSKEKDNWKFEGRYRLGTMPLTPRLDVAQFGGVQAKYLF